MNRTLFKLMAALGLVLGLLILSSCGESRTPFVGSYKSDAPLGGKTYVELLLRDNGEADWTMVEENKTLKFKWRVEDGRVWLYTKEGGIIIATPTDGGRHLSADLSGDWHPGCPPQNCLTFTRQKK